MKKILLAIMALCFVATVGYSQEKASPLTLTIKSDKQVYEVGEAVRLMVEMSNVGRQDI